jgi:preprotein translocase subunit SecA
MIALQVIDSKWKEHLLAMDELRDGIWTVGYGERNPLVEYKLRGFRIFQEVILRIKQDIVEFLTKVQFKEMEEKEEPVRPVSVGHEEHRALNQFTGGDPFGSGAQPSQIVKNGSKEPEVPIEGGSKRKKTRRSRKG